MTHSKTVSFQFEGKEYEVRVAYKDGRFCVRAYLNNQLMNGYEYCVDEITDFDFLKSQGITAVDHLVEVAQSDVKNKVWEKYIAAVEALKNRA